MNTTAPVQYFERLWCSDCVTTHWLQVLRSGREVCHGLDFQPKCTPTQYTRHFGRGIQLVHTDESPALDSYLESTYEERDEQ